MQLQDMHSRPRAPHLDDGVLAGLREVALAPGALDVKRQHAQRRDAAPLAWGVRGNIITLFARGLY